MKILLIGGTGSVGQILLPNLLNKHKVGILSRDDFKQEDLRRKYPTNVTFHLGSVNSHDSLEKAMEDYDAVIHLASIKQIPVQEANPWRSVEVNVQGTMNVLRAMTKMGITRGILASSSNVIEAASVYGCTKFLQERLWLDRDYTVVRFGTLLSSRGAITYLFRDLGRAGQPITVTDPDMTRFFMKNDEVISLIDEAIEWNEAGTLVYNCNSYGLGTMAKVYADNYGTAMRLIGARKGDKKHISLISNMERRKSYYDSKYGTLTNITIVGEGDIGPAYSSEDHLVSKEDLTLYLGSEGLL